MQHLQWAKELRKEGERLGRAGLSERVIELVKDFDGSYKGAMHLAGQLKAISQAAKFDDYWTEKVERGFHREHEQLPYYQKKPDPYMIDEDNKPLTDEEIKRLRPASEVLRELDIPVPTVSYYDKPIAIYTKVDAELFHNSPHDVREAWNAYAQKEADKFNATKLNSRDFASCYHEWVPPLSFTEWQFSTKEERE